MSIEIFKSFLISEKTQKDFCKENGLTTFKLNSQISLAVNQLKSTRVINLSDYVDNTSLLNHIIKYNRIGWLSAINFYENKVKNYDDEIKIDNRKLYNLTVSEFIEILRANT